MALYMNRIIDFDQSKTEGKFTVKSGVDPELDRSKYYEFVHMYVIPQDSLFIS